MNKEEFLNSLRSELKFLVKGEIDKEVDKYRKIFDSYSSLGQSDEEIINSLGSYCDLAKAIYLSRGLDINILSKSNQSLNDNIIDENNDGPFKRFMHDLTSGDKQKFKKALSFVILDIIIVILLKAVFSYMRDVSYNLLVGVFSNISDNVVYFIFEILYFVFAIMFIIITFKKRYKVNNK